MIEELLAKISRLQSAGEPKFQQGLFRARRYYPYLSLRREDDNLFFTALTLAVLKDVKADLEYELRQVVGVMEQMALSNYHRYRVERDGTQVYQFWPEGRNRHFPNGHLLHRFKKFKSPPDADDTALAYQTFPHSLEEAACLQVYLQQFANGSRKWNQKVPPEFNLPKVYSTWMGTGAMPIEFDLVVMCNLLRTFRQYDLPVNEYDRATLDFIHRMIGSGFYLERPFVAAPWYPSALTIHFHLVKLASGPGIPDQWHAWLVEHLELLRPLARGFMQKILWNCSAARLGQPVQTVNYDDGWEGELSGFTFYIGGMLTALSSKSSWRLAEHPVFHWHFRCEAFYYALLLEHEILKKQAII